MESDEMGWAETVRDCEIMDGYTTGCGTYPPDIGDKNMCDGCKRGLTIIDGIHREQNGMPYMCCSRNRYS